MEAMTIRQAGAEGVVRALADGMQAAQYARALEAALAEKETLEAKCKALTDENAMKDREIARLRKENRSYRYSRSRAYAQVLEEQHQSALDGPARKWFISLLLALGGLATCIVILAVVLCVG